MIYHLVFILALHFVADFLLQTRKMGLNKSKSVMWLSIHVGVYLITFLIAGLLLGHHVLEDPTDMVPILQYVLLNAIIHWVTDFCTSRLGGYCYLKSLKYKEEGNDKKEHIWQYHFWSVIGLDFTLHIITLITTYFIIF